MSINKSDRDKLIARINKANDLEIETLEEERNMKAYLDLVASLKSTGSVDARVFIDLIIKGIEVNYKVELPSSTNTYLYEALNKSLTKRDVRHLILSVLTIAEYADEKYLKSNFSIKPFRGFIQEDNTDNE